MNIDFADTMPAPRNEQRQPREQRVSGAGMSLLLLIASSAVVACYGLAMLFAFVWGVVQ